MAEKYTIAFSDSITNCHCLQITVDADMVCQYLEFIKGYFNPIMNVTRQQIIDLLDEESWWELKDKKGYRKDHTRTHVVSIYPEWQENRIQAYYRVANRFYVAIRHDDTFLESLLHKHLKVK